MRVLKLGANEHTQVVAVDDNNQYLKTNSLYVVETVERYKLKDIVGAVLFQRGPVERGANGVENEHCIAMVIDRLGSQQLGKNNCRENAIAIEKLEEALEVLGTRKNAATH